MAAQPGIPPIVPPAKAAKPKISGRGGGPVKKSAAPAGQQAGQFEKLHPRGRAGLWIVKPGAGTGQNEPPDQTTAQLQERLRQLGFHVPADGRNGPATQAAVREFQQRYGLDPSGGVDAATLEVLQNPPTQTLRQVQKAQGLNAQGKAISTAKATAKKATSGAKSTAKATSSGTTSKIKATAQTGGGGTTATFSSLGSSSLHQGIGVTGARNRTVTSLQRALTQAGFKVDADGRFGPDTVAAVKKLQRKYGLPADGIVGDDTKGLLVGLTAAGGTSQSMSAALKSATTAAAKSASAAKTTSGRKVASGQQTLPGEVAVRMTGPVKVRAARIIRLPDLEEAAAPGHVYHWKHGWIRIDAPEVEEVKGKVGYRKTKAGDWVASGPENMVVPGKPVTVTTKAGKVKNEMVASVGKSFDRDGEKHRYGYLTGVEPHHDDPEPQKVEKGADLGQHSAEGNPLRVGDAVYVDGKGGYAYEGKPEQKETSGNPEHVAVVSGNGKDRWPVALDAVRTTPVAKPQKAEEPKAPEEPAKPAPTLPGDKPTLFESNVCSRCGGEGKIWTYSNVMGGRCFKCGGRGRVLTKRGQKAQDRYRDLLSKRADQLQPGDKFYEEGVPGFTSSKWRTVKSATPLAAKDAGSASIYDPKTDSGKASIEKARADPDALVEERPDGSVSVKHSSLRIAFEDGESTTLGPGKKLRMYHALDEKKDAAAKARAYQDTLKKDGTPYKISKIASGPLKGVPIIDTREQVGDKATVTRYGKTYDGKIVKTTATKKHIEFTDEKGNKRTVIRPLEEAAVKKIKRLEESTVAFGFGGDYSRSIKDVRDQEPLYDLPIWTRTGRRDRPSLEIPDSRSFATATQPESSLTDADQLRVALGEATTARKTARDGFEFARARARERMLRQRLAEAPWTESLHPRGRAGKWMDKPGGGLERALGGVQSSAESWLQSKGVPDDVRGNVHGRAAELHAGVDVDESHPVRSWGDAYALAAAQHDVSSSLAAGGHPLKGWMQDLLGSVNQGEHASVQSAAGDWLKNQGLSDDAVKRIHSDAAKLRQQGSHNYPQSYVAATGPNTYDYTGVLPKGWMQDLSSTVSKAQGAPGEALREAWEERMHPRGRGGKWVDVLGKIEPGDVFKDRSGKSFSTQPTRIRAPLEPRTGAEVVADYESFGQHRQKAAGYLRDFAENGAESGQRREVLNHAASLEGGGPISNQQRHVIADHLEDFSHNGAESGMRDEVQSTAAAIRPSAPREANPLSAPPLRRSVAARQAGTLLPERAAKRTPLRRSVNGGTDWSSPTEARARLARQEQIVNAKSQALAAAGKGTDKAKHDLARMDFEIASNELERLRKQAARNMTQSETMPDRWYALQEAVDARKVAIGTEEWTRAYARERVLRRQLEERDVSTKERGKLEAKGHAMKGGRYPIKHGGDLKAAVKAFGRGNPPDKEAIKQHIIKRAKDLKLAHTLPDSWGVSTA